MTEEIEKLTKSDIRDIKNRDNTVVVLEEGEWGDEEFQFTFQAVGGQVLLGCNIRAYVAGEVKRREEDPVALTTRETVKLIRRLLDVTDEALEQKEK